jgi:hypothetical protein
MSEAGTSFLLSQLGYQVPVLLVYLVGIILALVYMRRASLPCALTLTGIGILVVAMVGVAVVQASLMDSRQADGRGPRDIAQLMRSVAIAGSCIRALGVGLLVAAIFVGRRPVAGGLTEVGGGTGVGSL